MSLFKKFSEIIGKFYIVFLLISLPMIRLASFVIEKLGEGFIGYVAVVSAFVTTVCLFLQLADKLPLEFVMIKGGNVNRRSYKLGASSDDIKREQIKSVKQKSLYIATVSFSVMIIFNLMGLVLALLV